MPSPAPNARSRKRASGRTSRPMRSPMRRAVCMALPRSEEMSASTRSAARRAAIASACAIPFSVSSLSRWPWMRISTFQRVSPWRTTMKMVPRTIFGGYRTYRAITKMVRGTIFSSELRRSAHEGHERLGHRDRSVGVLAVLEDRDERAPDRQPRAVERVHGLDLSLRVAIARLHAPCLERLEVGARGNLAIRVLSRQPHLQVVGLRRGEAGVAGAQQHHAI